MHLLEFRDGLFVGVGNVYFPRLHTLNLQHYLLYTPTTHLNISTSNLHLPTSTLVLYTTAKHRPLLPFFPAHSPSPSSSPTPLAQLTTTPFPRLPTLPHCRVPLPPPSQSILITASLPSPTHFLPSLPFPPPSHHHYPLSVSKHARQGPLCGPSFPPVV